MKHYFSNQTHPFGRDVSPRADQNAHECPTERRQCFIGVDLGTSRSGYAYSLCTDTTSPPHIPQRWLPGDPDLTPKTSTALLFDQQWKRVAWGTEAINMFKAKKAAAGMTLIEGKQFKLALASAAMAADMDAASMPEQYKLPIGCPLTTDDLVVEMLKCLRQHAAEHFKLQQGENLDSLAVHYCLSVPAGWSDKSKERMRRAAERAGMIMRVTGVAGEIRSTTAVTLLHEPEAAAVTACCGVQSKNGGRQLQAVPGKVWVVLDAGGGTVDLAMHKVEAGAKSGEAHLSEVIRSRCITMGSTMLDHMAEEYILKPLFSAKEKGWFETWKRQNPQSYISQMSKWEDVKLQFDGGRVLDLEIVAPLIKHLPSDSPAADGFLELQPSKIAKLVFDPVLEPILDNLEAMLTTARADGGKGADVLLLVGGFGSSRYLHSTVSRRCRDLPGDLRFGGTIISPTSANYAVVHGNTIHLQRPGTIVARCSRLTYGLCCASLPLPLCESMGYVDWDGKRRERHCFRHFLPLVKAGQIVRVDRESGQAPSVVVQPLPGVEHVTLKVYTAENADTQHITEPGVDMVGSVKLDVRKSRRLLSKQSCKDYHIRVSFLFGAAQLEVLAHDITNNITVATTVDFVSDPATLAAVLPYSS